MVGLGFIRQTHADRELTSLGIDFSLVIAIGTRAKHYAAAFPNRRTTGTMTSATSTFLFPRFLATTTHFTFALGVGPWFALIIGLLYENLMHHCRLYFDTKNF